MNELVDDRTEVHLQTLISYLLGDQKGIIESVIETRERYLDSVNAFYDMEAFSISHEPQGSFRIGCQCGWSLSFMFRGDLAFDMDSAPPAECLRRMVTHYEIQHNGLNGTGIVR